ncbi:MAG: hypothetical protein J1F38_05255 [Muribaculaceae bacterium]|nr:hypothetical protein [Muribaculaceae bacterium]
MSTKLSEPVFNPENYFAAEGDKGMTSTSANKLANLAKERNREDMLFIESVRFVNEEMSLLTSPAEKVLLLEGMKGDSADFSKIKEAMLRVARFNSFISWVREAIKAKDSMIGKVKLTSLTEWCKKNNIDLPKVPLNKVEEDLEENRAASKIGIEDMARYFINESKASVLGQAIHPEGSIARARKNLMEASIRHSYKEGEGKDMVITTLSPTADIKAVTDFYMSLQSDWRHAESLVNQSKNEWEQADSELRLELTNEYNKKMREHENLTARIKSDWEKWKLEEVRRIGKLKIRIPQTLQPVLDELLALGKDSQ